jgi:Ethanolamine utilization protein EutJ (predicted chaperonin)
MVEVKIVIGIELGLCDVVIVIVVDCRLIK